MQLRANQTWEMSLSVVAELRTMTLAPKVTFMPWRLEDSGTETFGHLFDQDKTGRVRITSPIASVTRKKIAK